MKRWGLGRSLEGREGTWADVKAMGREGGGAWLAVWHWHLRRELLWRLEWAESWT